MSQHECNKMLRVLNGGTGKLKYTARVYHKDGEITEFQCEERPKIFFNVEARCLWLSATYEAYPIMAWPDGAILLCEENPKA